MQIRPIRVHAARGAAVLAYGVVPVAFGTDHGLGVVAVGVAVVGEK